MYADGSPSERSRSETPGAQAPSLDARLAAVRAQGCARLRVGAGHRRTLREEGALRLRFPRERLDRIDATLVNVAGGMTGGDRFVIDMTAQAGARLAVTSVAAEKIYRSAGAHAHVDVTLGVEAGAALYWIPQETIVFNGARLQRDLSVDMAGDARLLACEMTMLGRPAMGETMGDVGWRERWRLRRDGRLVYADDTRLEGDAAQRLAARANGAGARAFAALVYAGPDALDALEPARAALAGHSGCEAGVSAFDGLLSLRILAATLHDMRAGVIAALRALPDCPLPRSWFT